jgi:baculoviral IAP repeat-containing protein 6
MNPSLVSLGHETYNHAKAYAQLTSNAAILKDLHSEGNKETLALCREILGFYQTAKVTAPKAPQTTGPSTKDSWTTFSENNRVTYADDVLKIHMLCREFPQLGHSPPGRMTFLWREFASLSTPVPPGILLKVVDTRPDVMKALITGVGGSPYAGGLFAYVHTQRIRLFTRRRNIHFVLGIDVLTKSASTSSYHRPGRTRRHWSISQ